MPGEQKMIKIFNALSSVLSVLFVAFISLGRLFGSIFLSIIAGVGNIIRNIAGFMLGVFYEAASWLKATVRYSIGFIAELAVQVWRLLGAVIGLFFEGINMVRHAIGYVLGFIVAPYGLIKSFIGKAVGIGIAFLDAIRHLIGAVIGLLAQIPYFLFYGAIATINAIWYLAVRAVAIIAEFFMLLRPIGSFLFGMLAGAYHGAGKPLRVIVSVFYELASMIKHGLTVMAGFVAEVFSNFWHAIGTVLGLIAELVTCCYYEVRPLLRISAVVVVEFLYSGFYALRAVIGVLFELFNWVRRAVAQVLGTVLGLLRGLFYEKPSKGWANGRNFFLKNNILFGEEVTRENIGGTYKYIRGKEYTIGNEGKKLWQEKEFMRDNYKFLQNYKSIARHTVFGGKYYFGASYKHVVEYGFFGDIYYFGRVFNARLKKMEDNKMTASEAFTKYFNFFNGDYSLGKIWVKANSIKGINYNYSPKSFYKKVARNKLFGQKYELSTWKEKFEFGKRLIGNKGGFWYIHSLVYESALFGGEYEFGTTYNDVVQSDFFGGKCKFAENKAFKFVDNKFGRRYTLGFNFKQFNNSELFGGKKSWLQQKVARKTFKAIAGYEFSEILSKLPIERAKKDYKIVKNNCNKVLTTASGFISGAVTMIPFGLIYYALAGAYGGGKASDWGFLVGAICGFFSGLVKGLSYPFRNAYLNLEIYNKTCEEYSLLDADISKLYFAKTTDWKKEPIHSSQIPCDGASKQQIPLDGASKKEEFEHLGNLKRV